MINNKSSKQKRWIRIAQLYIVGLIVLYIVFIFITLLKYNVLLGLIVTFMGIPLVILLFLFERIINYYNIVEVKFLKEGFCLFYNKRKIYIKYSDILSSSEYRMHGIYVTGFTTAKNFKAHLFERKGIFLSYYIDENIFKRIKKNHIRYQNSRKIN